MENDKASEYIAKMICVMNGMVLEDMDGSSNWWMFYNDADKLVQSLRERNFKFEAIYGKKAG